MKMSKSAWPVMIVSQELNLGNDNGVRLRGAHGVDQRRELRRDVIQIVAELVDAEHDVDLAEGLLAQKLRQRDRADVFHGDGLRLRDIDLSLIHI